MELCFFPGHGFPPGGRGCSFGGEAGIDTFVEIVRCVIWSRSNCWVAFGDAEVDDDWMTYRYLVSFLAARVVRRQLRFSEVQRDTVSHHCGTR